MLTSAGTLLLISALSTFGATPVLTRSYDNGRTGTNITETTFTPALVGTRGIAKVKSLNIPDDPRIEATPLYVPGLVMKKDGKAHNVVFVASMGNHVFAFDADAPQGKDLLWTSTLLGKPFVPKVINDGTNGQHRQTNVDLWGINILWGILSTPVIDLDAKQMYVVNWTASGDGKSQVLQLHHLGITDGVEIGTGQVLTGVAKDKNGKTLIDAHGRPVTLNADQKQRSALLLAPLRGPHKTLFIGITGGEVPGDPHGWMVAVDVDTFKETAAIPTTEQGFGGGIWQGAGGPCADDRGNVYVMTGNGGFDFQKAASETGPGHIVDFNGDTDFAESFIRFQYRKTGAAGALSLNDWYIAFRDSTRNNQGNPDYQDQDLGSGAPILPAGTNLLMGAGKDGVLYVLNRNNLGKKIEDPSVLKQPPLFATFNGLGLSIAPARLMDFPLGGGPDPGQGAPKKTHHQHSSPVAWTASGGTFFFDWGENESLRAWKVDPTTGAVTFVAKGAEIASRALALDGSIGGMTGGMISLSSSGGNNGLIWTLAPTNGNANTAVVAGALRVYDATTPAANPNGDGTPRMKLLWDSTNWNINFLFSKFCPPVVADGKLFVATYGGTVDVYTLTP